MHLRKTRSSAWPLFSLVALALSPALPRPAAAQEGKDAGFGMGPPASPALVAASASAATPVAPGPFEPAWDSIRENYKVPRWFLDGKFGIFLHWGVYSVPAYHNEWYQKHMYAAYVDWHAEHFGPQDRFGYKDFIPGFTCDKFDPDDWAALFRRAGARYVIPSAEHHDWFSLWDSDVSRWNSAKMGPKRDLIGDLARAVRNQGLKFGVSNHSIEHYTFIQPRKGLKSDLDDPEYADFYWTKHDDEALRKFLELWVAKNIELIDKYQVDMLWFDNGVNHRVYDPLKLKVAAYYYNRAKAWGKEVSISTKDSAYLAGSILDFEKVQRGPKGILPGAWQVDDPIGTTWGYTSDMRVSGPEPVIGKLVDVVSKGGNLLLNLSPRADGTIPEAQRSTLLAIGEWLDVNGEAIYGTHPWTRPSEGSGRNSFRFTANDQAVYAIAPGWPGERAVISSLASGVETAGKIESVTLLGHPAPLKFTRDVEGLKVDLPEKPTGKFAFTLKIAGIGTPRPEQVRPANPF